MGVCSSASARRCTTCLPRPFFHPDIVNHFPTFTFVRLSRIVSLSIRFCVLSLAATNPKWGMFTKQEFHALMWLRRHRARVHRPQEAFHFILIFSASPYLSYLILHGRHQSFSATRGTAQTSREREMKRMTFFA